MRFRGDRLHNDVYQNFNFVHEHLRILKNTLRAIVPKGSVELSKNHWPWINLSEQIDYLFSCLPAELSNHKDKISRGKSEDHTYAYDNSK